MVIAVSSSCGGVPSSVFSSTVIDRKRSNLLSLDSALRTASTVVTAALTEIGVPVHLKGYHYARAAIILSMQDSQLLEAVTKELYPLVASKFDTSASRVERAIRHAIEVSWVRGNVELIDAVFGYTVRSDKGRPTNSEFIALLSDRLRTQFLRPAEEEAPPD